MGLRKIFVLWPFIVAILTLQGCSNSSDQAQDSSSAEVRERKRQEDEFRQKDRQQPVEVKTLGALVNADAGVLSLENTGLKWKTLKDKISTKEFYLDAFQKGCFQSGQPQELLQIDKDLFVGQKFKMTFKDRGQGSELTTVKRRTILEIDRTKTELIYSSEFLSAKDSRIRDYEGPLVSENPFEKIKIVLGQSQLTQQPTAEFQILEMKLHAGLIKKLEEANGSVKVDCHLENHQNATEVLELGQVEMKSGQKVKANKKTMLSTGMVVCERVEHSPFSKKNELEKLRGQPYRMGPGKNIHMIVSSNQLPSPIYSFCGGARLLDFKLLVLDDGRVVQQRFDVIDEITK